MSATSLSTSCTYSSSVKTPTNTGFAIATSTSSSVQSRRPRMSSSIPESGLGAFARALVEAARRHEAAGAEAEVGGVHRATRLGDL